MKHLFLILALLALTNKSIAQEDTKTLLIFRTENKNDKGCKQDNAIDVKQIAGTIDYKFTGLLKDEILKRMIANPNKEVFFDKIVLKKGEVLGLYIVSYKNDFCGVTKRFKVAKANKVEDLDAIITKKVTSGFASASYYKHRLRTTYYQNPPNGNNSILTKLTSLIRKYVNDQDLNEEEQKELDKWLSRNWAYAGVRG